MSREYGMCGEKTDALRVLVGKPERKCPLGRFKKRQEENIKTEVKQDGDVDWTDLAQKRNKCGGGGVV